MTDVFLSAVGRWPSIHQALGVPSALLSGKQGPCPKCDGKTRFRFTDHDGKGGFYCNQCGPGDGFDLLQIVHGWTMREATDRVRAIIGVAPEIVRAQPRAQSRKKNERESVWSEAGSLASVPAVRAWWIARAGFVPSTPSLRASPRLIYPTNAESYPGMVARVVSPTGDRAVQLHRTFLTPAGTKAEVDQPRLLMPKLNDGEMDGAAVRLADFSDRLGIAEGIETAIAATLLFGIPCWAALTAVGLTKWAPPPGVEVTIFADNDAHKRFTGIKAAADLAHRLTGEKVRVAGIQIPPKPGDDWNDVLLSERRRAA